MTKESVQFLLALWALILLCTLSQTAASSTSSQVRSRVHVEKSLNISQQADNRNGSHSHRRKLSVKQMGPMDQVTLNSSRATNVIPGRSSTQIRSDEDLCAYRVVESGIGGQLCFRHTLPQYKCQKGQCRTVVSFGNLVANILINGSVLLQWTEGEEATVRRQDNNSNGQNISKDPGTNLTTTRRVVSRQHHRRVGFELSCWWNGSYTQFECTGVQLAGSCRDYLLTELHENIPYRICLLSLSRSTHSPQERDCVEFILPPSGMQDIVIAMTTVGGAICVMLVIICLLVAYITENIMSPTSTHTYPYRTHSRH